MLLIGILFLIITCGSEDQPAQLVDTVIVQHEILIYFLWGIVFLQFIL